MDIQKACHESGVRIIRERAKYVEAVRPDGLHVFFDVISDKTPHLEAQTLRMLNAVRMHGKKADVKPARMLAANHRAKGGVIRLWPDECISFGLAVAEGIETALSVAHAIVPAWACIDAGNLSRLAVLNGVNSLVIAADGDEVGRMAAKECAARWRRSRKPVAVMDPGDGRDWNDEVAA